MQSESNKITKAEWKKLFPEKYRKALRLGVFDEICEEMGWKIGVYSELKTAQDWAKYVKELGAVGLKDWNTKKTSSYTTCRRLGLQREVAKILGWNTPEDYRSLKTAEDWAKYAKDLGVVGLRDWQIKQISSYTTCCRLKLQREVAKILNWDTRKDHSDLKTIEDFIKYVKELGAIGLSDWNKKNGRSYTVCVKLGLQKEVAKILNWDTRKDYSDLKTIEDWVKCAKELGAVGLRDWEIRDLSSYSACCKLGLQREVAKTLGWKIKGELK